jgi:hypothetical protein
MRKILNTGAVLGLLLLLTACQKEIPHYRGYYFDAMIENAHVIPLKNKASIPLLNSYVRQVHWQLDKPIDGHMNVTFSENKNSKDFIGHILNREPMDIVALRQVNLDTNAGLQSDSSVRFSGAAAVTRVDILKKNFLPKGDYVFRLKVHGTNNWDRKEIYVQVR